MIRRIIHFLVIVLLFSCSKKKEGDEKAKDATTKVEKESKAIPIVKVRLTEEAFSGKGILVSSSFDYINDRFEKVVSPVLETGLVVDIIAKSKELFPQEGDVCQRYPYVKIKSNAISGWVYGSQIFSFRDDVLGSVLLDSIPWKVFTARDFGIGAFDPDGTLTGCNEFYPIVFQRTGSEEYTLVDISKSEKVHSDFNYANLKISEQLLGIEMKNQAVIFEVDAEYMESAETYDIVVKRPDDESGLVGSIQNRKERPL